MADMPAWVTFTAVVITGTLSIAGNQLVEYYKTRAGRATDELNARRDYEYEALKRLYTETEPLLFQFYDYGASTINRIANVARAARDGKFDGPKSWWSDPYYLRSTVHAFLAPLAAFAILRDRLTLVDLSLDQPLERQYELGKALTRAWNSDFLLARDNPTLEYKPDSPDAERRIQEPGGDRVYRRQGVYAGDVQRAVSALVIGEGPAQRVRNFSDFSDAYDDRKTNVKTHVQPFVSVFEDFVPPNRPVLWRIIMTQLFLYRAARLYRSRELSNAAILSLAALTTQERADYAFSTRIEDKDAVDQAYSIGLSYLEKVLFPSSPLAL